MTEEAENLLSKASKSDDLVLSFKDEAGKSNFSGDIKVFFCFF